MRTRDRQRGVALLVVLWACTLLAILVGGYASIARIETGQQGNALAMQKARYAAEDGGMRSIRDIYERRRADPGPDVAGRWIGDGHPFAFELGDAKVVVKVEDE